MKMPKLWINKFTLTLTGCGLLGGVGLVIGQVQSVVDTVHNLSASGPGNVRAASEEQVCIFCHTPHNAAPIQPLWNRYMPVDAYAVYSSSALDADPGQPTGSSKMCLACHDGTIALGSVVSRAIEIQMQGGITKLPAGATNLGTDLRDDHPISFRYDTALWGKDPHLVDPALLPPAFKLDGNQELQCTTCHEVHDNSRGHFLVADNSESALCKSCHTISTTTITEHADCVSCHRTHTAPSGPFLLQEDRVTTTCISCHDGNHATAANIETELSKFSVHDTNREVDPLNPIPHEVTCTNCHDPHTMTTGTVIAPGIPPNFGEIAGINLSGSVIAKARTEYEVCFKCHADDNAFNRAWIDRQITQVNTRLEFAANAASFHPVAAPGRSSNVPSLKPGWTESSIISCSDCHNSDSSRKSGGSGANGVHGSNEEPLLIARYETADFTRESASAYALCYRCHYRDGDRGILKDRSFEEHKKHIEGENVSCATCHDPHGISQLDGNATNNSHLINFDTSIVFPDPDTGLLKYESTGEFSGRCFLECHSKKHSPEEYGR